MPLVGLVALSGVIAGFDRAILALVSIVGSIIVAWAVYQATQNQDRVKATLEMHRDYYSSPFGEKRELAIKFFKLYYSTNWVSEDPYDVPDPEASRDGYSEVLRFFHRFAILWNNERLDNAMAVALFSRELGFWWGYAFCRMKARTNWWTGPMVYSLARQVAEQGGWATFRQGYRSGRKLRLYGEIRVLAPDGTARKSSRSDRAKSKWTPATQHWL